MSKLFIVVLIYGCLILNFHCYANINSEREEILKEMEADDFYDGDNNDIDDKRSDETLDNENRPRESDEDDDAYDDFQRDAEVAANEDNDEPIRHSFYKKELMDVIYYGRRADPGCSWSWGYCSRGCCLKAFKCRDCRKKFYLLCGAYLYPAKKGKRISTALRPTSDQSNWMKKYKSKELRDTIMPGSHHSGIYHPEPKGLKKWDIPQIMSVANQLKVGVRFMDVRVATGPFFQQPYVVHAFKYQELRALIRSIVNFLKKHQSEVVVIRLKKGDGIFPKWIVNWRKVDSVLQNYADFIYGSPPMERKLSDLGGKIIICQDGSGSSFEKLTCKGSWVTTHTNNPAKLTSKMTKWLKSQKKPWTKFHYLEAICTAEKGDILGVGCKRDGTKALYRFHSIKEMASECNYKVYNWLKDKKKTVSEKVNAVMMDFANPKIMNYIINMN